MQLKQLLNNVCVARVLATHLCGKDHHFIHRAAIGACLMLAGDVIAHAAGHFDVPLLTIFGDTFGYGLHGVGLVPYVEAVLAAE